MGADVNDLVPLLACTDIAAEHDFLVTVLGFESTGLERTPDGAVVHGEVRAGSHRIWLHQVNAGEFEPPGRGPAGGGIVVQVADVESHYAHARAAGAEIIYPPRDQEYGQREYGVRDPEGHLWWIATVTEPPAAR